MKRKYIVPLLIIYACIGTMQLSAQTKYSLEDCKKMAIENNRTIKNSRLEIEAAKQTKKMPLPIISPKVNATGMDVVLIIL